jgi:riboflavin synthase
VDGVGQLLRCHRRGEAIEAWIRVPAELLGYCAAKGSITLDGVSLTINQVEHSEIMVGLVPHTLAVTTLGKTEVGADLNIEIDLIARYVARLMGRDT